VDGRAGGDPGEIMSVPRDDDAQRDMERRALLNVHTLAERLGASDKVDRRTEKAFAKWIGAIVALVILALGLQMLLIPSSQKDIETKRCEIDAAADVVMEMRRDLKARTPALTDVQLERLVVVTDTPVKSAAEARCRAAMKPKG
jgi:hypothetical protein